MTGYAGSRDILRGTLYKPNNPQIIKMAIGKLGIKNAATKGGIISICVAVPLRIAEHFWKDQKCLNQLLANITTDVCKITAQTIAFGIAATLATGASIPVIVPIAAGALVAFVTGYALDLLDNHYGITADLTRWLKKMRDDKIAYSGKMQYYKATRAAAVRRTGHTGLYGGI